MAVTLCRTLGRRQTRATDADGERMGGATTSTSCLTSATSTNRCLVGGASLRTRGGVSGSGLGG